MEDAPPCACCHHFDCLAVPGGLLALQLQLPLSARGLQHQPSGHEGEHGFWYLAVLLRCVPSISPPAVSFQMARVCWWFFFSKIIELSDTVGGLRGRLGVKGRRPGASLVPSDPLCRSSSS